ncbi:MAG: hypothetical protein SFW67_07165 [Myxococcaceae bacterium]|nr:hypothetical protein [Myxococcaceae bacterium]
MRVVVAAVLVLLAGCGVSGRVEFVPEPGLVLPPAVVLPGQVVTVAGSLELRNGTSTVRSLDVRVSPDDAALEVEVVGTGPFEPGTARRLDVRAALTSVGAKRWTIEVAGASAVVTAEGLAPEACTLFPRWKLPAQGDFVREVRLENQGAGPCFLKSVRIEGRGELRVVDRPALVRPVPAGGFLVVNVEGRAEPLDDARLVVEPVAGDTVRVPLTQPCGLVLSPNHLSFDETALSCGPKEKTVQVTSTCPGEVSVSVRLYEAGPFALVGGPRQTSLSAGQVLPLVVRFAPERWGSFSSGLFASIENLEEPLPFVASIDGRAFGVGFNVDRFSNEAPLQTDTLLVVDTGSSLRQAMALVRGGPFPAWPHADLHVAMTIWGSDGALRPLAGGSPVLSSKTHTSFAPLVDAWPEAAPRVPNASCLETALLSLGEPNRTGPHAQFRREGAPLVVVCLSDRADATTRSAADLRAALGPRTTVHSWGDASGVLAEVVREKGGVAVPLSDSLFDQFGRSGFSPRKTFFLNSLAVPGEPMLVLHEGFILEPVDATGRRVWSYDATLNAVVFDDWRFGTFEVRYRTCR